MVQMLVGTGIIIKYFTRHLKDCLFFAVWPKTALHQLQFYPSLIKLTAGCNTVTAIKLAMIPIKFFLFLEAVNFSATYSWRTPMCSRHGSGKSVPHEQHPYGGEVNTFNMLNSVIYLILKTSQSQTTHLGLHSVARFDQPLNFQIIKLYGLLGLYL